MGADYILEVPGVQTRWLRQFVRTNMPDPAWLEQELRRYFTEGCKECGSSLKDYADCYYDPEQINLKDRKKEALIWVRYDWYSRTPAIWQHASGGGECRPIKDRLRLIVRAYFKKKLKAKRIKTTKRDWL